MRTGSPRLATGLPRISRRPLLRLPREDREIERRAGVEAGRGLMVLVDHHVEAGVVGFQVLVEIAVIEVRADPGIIEPVRDRHPHVVELVERRQMRIGHLGEVPGFHVRLLRSSRVRRRSATRTSSSMRSDIDGSRVVLRPEPTPLQPMKPPSTFMKASGCSMCGRWPALAITLSLAPGISSGDSPCRSCRPSRCRPARPRPAASAP